MPADNFKEPGLYGGLKVMLIEDANFLQASPNSTEVAEPHYHATKFWDDQINLKEYVDEAKAQGDTADEAKVQGDTAVQADRFKEAGLYDGLKVVMFEDANLLKADHFKEAGMYDGLKVFDPGGTNSGQAMGVKS